MSILIFNFLIFYYLFIFIFNILISNSQWRNV